MLIIIQKFKLFVLSTFNKTELKKAIVYDSKKVGE